MRIDKQETYITRRRFLSALITSVVMVGCPLPIGFPKTAPERLPQGTYKAVIIDIEVEPKVIHAKLLMAGKTISWRIPI